MKMRLAIGLLFAVPLCAAVHGGAWRQGDKGPTVQPFFEPISEAGFAWFSVNYRLAPAHLYPAAVDDVAAAIRFIKARAAEYRIDPRRIALLGESAGGHIAALIGARQATELGIAAVVPFYAPTDLDALVEGSDQTPNARRAVLQFLGIGEVNAAARAALTEASPLHYVHAGMPPYLFVHGTADASVPIAQSELGEERAIHGVQERDGALASGENHSLKRGVRLGFAHRFRFVSSSGYL